jgi:hypothetical protein
MIAAQEKEMVRYAVIECLTARHPAALPLPAIRRRVAVQLDFKFEDQDLESALDYWKSKGCAIFDYLAGGPTMYWQATANGVDFIERRR